MQAAETAGKRRVILQAFGPIAKLVEHKVDIYKKMKEVLTRKFIEIKPYLWLEKLENRLKNNHRNLQGT